MSGFTYQIRLDVIGGEVLGKLTSSLTGIQSALGVTNNLLRGVQANILAVGAQSNTSLTGVRVSLARIADAGEGSNRTLQGMNTQLGQINTNLQRLGGTAGSAFGSATAGIGSFVAQLMVVERASAALTKTMDFESLENSIRFSGGAEGAANLDFVRKVAGDLSLPMESAVEGFRTLSGSVMGTKVSMTQAKDIFQGVSKAALVMGLSAEQSKGVFVALGQMASKGGVMAQELKLQLGERLPGAFSIAARAMGVTTAQLSKMMEDGLDPTEFLPKFAIELEKTFGSGVSTALGTSRAQFNALQNQLLDLQLTFGQKLMPVVGQFVSDYIKPAIDFVKNHADGILELGGVLLGIYGTYQLVSTGFVLWNGGVALANFLTPILTGEMTLLNAVMALNPVFLITAGLVALGGAIIYAWKHFEGFRGFMYGMWEVIKVFGHLIYDFAIAPLMAWGKIMVGVFTLNFDLIKQGMDDGLTALKAMATDYLTAGQQIGEAFQKGYANGVKGFQASQAPVGGQQSAVAKAFAGATGDKKADSPLKEVAKSKSEGISGGGRQIRNINISIQKQGIDNITVHTVNMKEGRDEIKDMFLRLFVETVNAANQIQ